MPKTVSPPHREKTPEEEQVQNLEGTDRVREDHDGQRIEVGKAANVVNVEIEEQKNHGELLQPEKSTEPAWTVELGPTITILHDELDHSQSHKHPQKEDSGGVQMETGCLDHHGEEFSCQKDQGNLLQPEEEVRKIRCINDESHNGTHLLLGELLQHDGVHSSQPTQHEGKDEGNP